MRVALILITLSLLLQNRESHAQRTKQQTETDQRGTEKAPIVVKVVPPENHDEEAAQEKKWREDQSNANWWMVRFTLAYGIVVLGQLVIFALQARRLRQTIKKMEDIANSQTADMNKSIAESARAATAMEASAKVMSDSVKLQEIAYEQWLESKNWAMQHTPALPFVSFDFLSISFDIENPTAFPLMLNEFHIFIDGVEAAVMRPDVRLGPKASWRANGANRILNEEQAEKFHTSGMALAVNCDCTFTDIRGRIKHWDVGRMCVGRGVKYGPTNQFFEVQPLAERPEKNS